MSQACPLLLVFVFFVGWRAGAADGESHLVSAVVSEQDFTGGGPSNQFPRAKGVYNGLIMPDDSFIQMALPAQWRRAARVILHLPRVEGSTG